MRPTVQEQLQGSCRVLETVVAPHVAEPFARTILDNLIANLWMLAGAAPKVTAFILADNAATREQLLLLRGALHPDLVLRVDEALAAPQPEIDDEAAQEEQNRKLRELLALAVCSPTLSPDMRRSIEAFMMQRASRVPMRYVSTVAASPKPASN